LELVSMRLRPWDESADTVAVQQLASRLWPAGPHPGGLGWSAATGQLPANVIVAAEASGSVAGWAGYSGAAVELQADPARPEAARMLIEWAVANAAGPELRVTVYDGDECARWAVTGAGFTADPAAGPAAGMLRSARGHGPVLPDGYRIRSVRPDELDARVEVHRAAWRPLTLPWPGDVPAGVTAEVTSRVTPAMHERVRGTWLYDESRDLVVEAPDGTLAGCCIVWWDPATGSAEIEPLGVVPGHRHKGLAGALCLDAAARVAALGGTQLFINTWPDPAYPAPAAAYLAAGFQVVSRGRAYHRRAA
jgi:GNAT superfamily N-acetyltransferase